MSNPVKPEDVLPNGVDSTAINGKVVRKGTIAAFLANADILENPSATENEKKAAHDAMKDLAPDVIIIGLHKHVRFINPEVEKILADIAK